MNFKFCSKFVRTLACMSVMMFTLPLIKSPQAFVIPPEQINKFMDEYVREEIVRVSKVLDKLENTHPEAKSFTEILQYSLMDNLRKVDESNFPLVSIVVKKYSSSDTAKTMMQMAIQQSLAEYDVVMDIDREADWKFMTTIFLTGRNSLNKEQFKQLLKSSRNYGATLTKEFLNTTLFRFKSSKEVDRDFKQSGNRCLFEPVVPGDKSPFVNSSGLQLYPGVNIPGVPYTPAAGSVQNYVSCRRHLNRERIKYAPNETDVPSYFSRLFSFMVIYWFKMSVAR